MILPNASKKTIVNSPNIFLRDFAVCIDHGGWGGGGGGGGG